MIAAITNTATNTIMFIRIIFKANDPSSLDCLLFIIIYQMYKLDEHMHYEALLEVD